MAIEIQDRARVVVDAAAAVVRRLRTDEALAASVFVLGLWLDRQWPVAGQLATSALAWTVFLRLAHRADDDVRLRLWFCLVWAAVGEIFCSLVWGLYTYRLENIPFFVPPGHVLLFWLGLRLAPRLSPAWADRLTLVYLLIAASLALWARSVQSIVDTRLQCGLLGHAAAASAARIDVLGGNRARVLRYRARRLALGTRHARA